MKLRDKVMYFGSSVLTLLALAIYLSFAPVTAKAACNGCLMGGNCYSPGTCWTQYCAPHQGQLCVQLSPGSYMWYGCGSCTSPW